MASSMSQLSLLSTILLLIPLAHGRLIGKETGNIITFGCSRSAVTINATSLSDIYSRMQYSNTTSVIIKVKANITIDGPDGLYLNQSFSCTRFTADPLGTPTWINYTRNDIAAVRLYRVVNLDFIGISFSFPVDYTVMPACTSKRMPDWATGLICPCVHIYWSYNINLVFGTVIGRTDVYRSGVVRISYMTLAFNFLENPFTATNYATLRIGLGGDGRSLIKSQILVTNNYIYGSWVNILVYYFAVGVVISNNYLTNAQFGGVQCSVGVNNVADCMLNTFVQNYIIPNRTPHLDGAGFYFDTHWFNPGNYLSCNYVVNYAHCVYVDYVSSHIFVDGGVCYKTVNGFKMNGGAFNYFRNVLIVQNKQNSVALSCQNYCQNNCLMDPGQNWNDMFESLYAPSTFWQQYFPNLFNWCDRTDVNGLSCNPNITLGGNVTNDGCQTPTTNVLAINPATGTMFAAPANLTGNCSGIPHMNNMQLIVVAGPSTADKWGPTIISCGALAGFKYLNNFTGPNNFNFPLSFFGFNNATAGDFGIDNLSDPVYQLFPKFKSCRKSNVGIQPIAKSGIKFKSIADSAKEPPQWWLDSLENFPPSQYNWNRPDVLQRINERILKHNAAKKAN